MKSNLNIKIIKLAVAEVVMQCGFDRISEQSLNLISDMYKFYIEQIYLRINKICGQHVKFDCISSTIINDFVISGSYEEKELRSFLDLQIYLKKGLLDKLENKQAESILHAIKIIPNNLQLTSAMRINNNNYNTTPEVKNQKIEESMEIDERMAIFIEECLFEKKTKEVKAKKYNFNVLEIIDDKKKEVISIQKEDQRKMVDNLIGKIDVFNEPLSILNDYQYMEARKIYKKF